MTSNEKSKTMYVTSDFARRDDCLDKMVPSDLRVLVEERDNALERLKVLTQRFDEINAMVSERDEKIKQLRKYKKEVFDLKTQLKIMYREQAIRELQQAIQALQNGAEVTSLGVSGPTISTEAPGDTAQEVFGMIELHYVKVVEK